MSEYDLLIKNAYVDQKDAVVDIGVNGGLIEDVKEDLSGSGTEEIDAEGNLVSSGFIDCHKHIDYSYSACGCRKPKENNTSPPSIGLRTPTSTRTEGEGSKWDDYFESVTEDEIFENAVSDIKRSVESGITHLRSHVTVDYPKNMEACIRAKEEMSDFCDVQLVPYPGNGILHEENEQKLRDAIELSGNMVDDKSVLVGGADPASRSNNIEECMTKWFEIATEYDIDIDVHIQDAGTLGAYTIERVVSHTTNNNYDGRITLSHAYSLGHLPQEWLKNIFEMLEKANIKLVTCYTSTPCSMPVKDLLENNIKIGHGTDNTQDFVFPHGDSDPIQAMLATVIKLHGDQEYNKEYRWVDTNMGLDAIWEMNTHVASDVFGIRQQYGINKGKRADLVVFDEPSRQWSIIRQAERSYVIKNGKVVVQDGNLLS